MTETQTGTAEPLADEEPDAGGRDDRLADCGELRASFSGCPDASVSQAANAWRALDERKDVG